MDPKGALEKLGSGGSYSRGAETGFLLTISGCRSAWLTLAHSC
jgi:hypothetical protein